MHKVQMGHVKRKHSLPTNVHWKWGMNFFATVLQWHQLLFSSLLDKLSAERKKITLVPFKQGNCNNQHSTTSLVPLVCYCSLYSALLLCSKAHAFIITARTLFFCRECRCKVSVLLTGAAKQRHCISKRKLWHAFRSLLLANTLVIGSKFYCCF